MKQSFEQPYDKMTKWWNDHLTKWPNDEMTTWRNDQAPFEVAILLRAKISNTFQKNCIRKKEAKIE